MLWVPTMSFTNLLIHYHYYMLLPDEVFRDWEQLIVANVVMGSQLQLPLMTCVVANFKPLA
jgi:hypothetical protein